MRITDVVTPEELDQIFERELNDVRKLGERVDLKHLYIVALADRLSNDYCVVLYKHVSPDIYGSAMLRLLALLDRFLEEKYANNSTTN